MVFCKKKFKKIKNDTYMNPIDCKKIMNSNNIQICDTMNDW